MNLIKKIKFNYLKKLITEYIENKNFEKASEEIYNLKNSDPVVYYFVIKSIDDYLNDISNINLHKKKIIWTISFDLDDQKYINNFLKFYLTENYKKLFHADNFVESLSQYLSSFNGHGAPTEIKFNEIVQNAGFFQNLLLFNRSEDLFIFDTCAAFFESKSKHYYIYPNTTLCYFYIVRDIKDLFSRYKKKLQTTEESYNELFNYTEKLYLSDTLKDQPFKIYENKTNYNTNINSWTDLNVISSYKGKIIPYDQLANNTEEVLVDTVQHLIQYYPDIKVNYQTIKDYVDKNKFTKMAKIEISKSEEKFLSRNLNIQNSNYKYL